MDALIIIAFVIVIILLYNIRSSQKATAAANEKDILFIKKQLEQLKKVVSVTEDKEAISKTATEDPLRWRPKSLVPQEEKIKEPESIVPPKEIPKEEIIISSPLINEFKPARTQETKPFVPLPEPESWSARWLKNNPDLEKFIGENLVNKIGITVLVLGIAFFVKYAIDQDWINEVGRVSIGIACGIAMIGIAHYLRNSYRSFSSVMAGGGIAVFYFTIAFAYHQYQLFDQTTAFVIMIIITAFAVALSLLYNKIELAVIALIGGFLAPFLVSSGSGNYVVLFTYLLILSTGILLISYFKKWPLLLALSFFFSWLIFNGWLLNDFVFSGKELPAKNGLLFATAFYLLFLGSSLINNLRTQARFKRFDFSFLLILTFSYYAQGMYILNEWNDGAYQGIFTISLAIVNLVLAWYLFRTQKGDKNLLYLLIGLTLTFISLVAPVQLNGLSITLFWSAECVLLYWLHQRSGIKIFKYSSVLILFCMAISLLLDWSIASENSNEGLPIIFSGWKGITTNVFAGLSLFAYAFLLSKNEDDKNYIIGIKSNAAKNIFIVAAITVLYITCLFGVNLYFKDLKDFTIPNAYHQLITYTLAVLVLASLKAWKDITKPFVQNLIVAACFAFYFSSAGYAHNLITGSIYNNHSSVHIVIHWLSAAALLYLAYTLISIYRKQQALAGSYFSWFMSIAILALFSLECGLLYISLFAKPATVNIYESNYAKAGLTIIWALFSFVMIWMGMKYKFKTLRIIALSIFTIALVKLFLFDIRNISDGGKIAAFIMLGILLLVISFMYQRLKKIIINNEEKIN